MDDGELSDPEGFGYSLNATDASANITNVYKVVLIKLAPEAITFLTVLYILATFAAVFGNISSIIVFTKGKKSRTDIRPFLLNLAVADLITGIFYPPFNLLMLHTKSWIFPPFTCNLVLFLQVFSISMSSCTNMAIGVDRLIAVLFPFKTRIMTSRSSCTIALIWLFSVAIAFVELFVARVVTLNHVEGVEKVCVENWGNWSLRLIYTWVISVCICFVPFTILTVSYSILAHVLWNRRAPGNENKSRDQMAIKAKRKVVKMLLVVVVMFGVCSLPFHICILSMNYHPDLFFRHGSNLLNMLYVLYWLAVTHSCVNPIIHGCLNDNFRDDLKELLKKSRFFSCMRYARNSTWIELQKRRRNLAD